jgi:hypothetical protein
MFLSMHNWMRAEKIGITIRRLAECGYDAIENMTPRKFAVF